MVNAMGSGTLVEVVNILRAEIKMITQFSFDLSSSQVCSIRLYCHGIAATHGIEAPH
jgi:hypothetical protein